MNVFYCKKCQRAVAGNNLTKCSKCGSKYISLNVDSSKWTSLNTEQKKKVLASRLSGNNASVSSVSSNATSDEVNDIWLWFLGFVPFISYILLPHFFSVGHGGAPKLMFFLSLIFYGLDLIALKNAGYDKGGWRYVGIILIPVYMFVRAQHTTRNWIPGIIWCVSFVVVFCIILGLLL